jgi:hypothetical protein
VKVLTLALAGIIVACNPQSSLSLDDENTFLNRFGGTWAGTATVVKNDLSWEISCQMSGQPGHHQIAIQADCRASIVQRSYTVNLAYNPGTGLYTGIYAGAHVGPAQLAGRRNGDRMNLTLTWPEPVDGDTVAKLFVENRGNGIVRISLIDSGTRTDYFLRQM